MDFSPFLGLFIGLCSFLIIGLFHPAVIKAEYYLGTDSWWIFLGVGIVFCVASIMVSSLFWSAILAVFAFSSFWSIKEIFEQQERVRKGWFARNPNRKYPFDKEEE